MRVLVVVATDAEARFLSDLPHRVVVSGVGAVSAALATQSAIMRERPDLVVSAGIGGAYPRSGLSPGQAAVATEMIYAGLGARDGGRFLDLQELGLELSPGVTNHLLAWPGARDYAARLGRPCGPFLTLETVTGETQVARLLEDRYPGALIEGMEGAGVAHAALLSGVPSTEVRGVSNMVGPRDRAAWQIGAALTACREALLMLN